MSSKKCNLKMQFLQEPIKSLNKNKMDSENKLSRLKNRKVLWASQIPEINWNKFLKKKETLMK